MNVMFKRLKLNLQLFAEGEPQNPPATPPANPPAPATPPTPAPTGKVFTEEYVSALREEAKSHRLQKKEFETHLRGLLGLGSDESITAKHVETFQQTQQKAVTEAIAKANARLVAAEIKALGGYDTKLVERLLDRSKVTIEEDGTVKGLKEAVEELAKEFPSIVVNGGGGTPPPNPGTPPAVSEIEQLEEALSKSKNQAERISIRNKIFQLQQQSKG